LLPGSFSSGGTQQVAFDVPKHGCCDPVDPAEVKRSDLLGRSRQQLGSDLIAAADTSSQATAADRIEAGPEGQQQQRQGAVGRGPAALRRPDESDEDQVLLALIGGGAVQPVQQGRRIPERR